MKQFDDFLKTLIGNSTKILQDEFLARQSELFKNLERRETGLFEREETLTSRQLSQMEDEKQLLESQLNNANRELTELRAKQNEHEENLEELRREMRSRERTAELETERSLLQRKLNEEKIKVEKLANEVKEQIEKKDATIEMLKSEIDSLKYPKMTEDSVEQHKDDKSAELSCTKEENELIVASFREQFREMAQKKEFMKENEDNREAWRKTAEHMLHYFTTQTSDSNPEATGKICKVLVNRFLGSSWFVYLITTTKNWTWKVNKGDFERWMGKTGPMSGSAPSGRPGFDLAIWGMICPDLNDEVSYNYDITMAITSILNDALNCLNERKACVYIVDQLKRKRIRWSVVYVAPIKTTSQSKVCHEHLFFTKKSNKLHIDVYLGA